MLSSRGSTNPLHAAAKGDAAAPQRPRVQDLFPSQGQPVRYLKRICRNVIYARRCIGPSSLIDIPRWSWHRDGPGELDGYCMLQAWSQGAASGSGDGVWMCDRKGLQESGCAHGGRVVRRCRLERKYPAEAWRSIRLMWRDAGHVEHIYGNWPLFFMLRLKLSINGITLTCP